MGLIATTELRDLVDREELVTMAQELIRCPSVNPPGNEREVAEVVADALDRLGAFSIESVSAADRRESIVARWGKPGGRVLVWNGHTDVVGVGDEAEWRFPPFAGVVADGRLWGRGAVDMKGPIAALLQALAVIRRAELSVRGELLLTIVADEETGGAFGSGHLAANGRFGRADGAICGEPTSLQALVAARGRLWLEIHSAGRSAHASQPELGRNAVAAIVDVAAALERLELPVEPHPLLGYGTLTVTHIEGGESPNSVPARCTLTIDRRFLPNEDADRIREQIANALAAIAHDRDVELELVERACFLPSEVDPSAEIVQTVMEATTDALGRRPTIGGMPGSTDARFLAAAGIPTIIFGPGDVNEAHTVNESIAVDELADGAAAYAAIITRFLAAD